MKRRGLSFALGALAALLTIGVLAAAPARYSVTCTAISNVALSTASETVFAAAANRKKLCLSNNDSSIAIYVAFHATATSADVRVPAGGSICETVEDGYIYAGVVDALAASGTPAISGWSCE